MSGLEVLVPAASIVEPLVVWVFQGIVHEYGRKFGQNRADEGIDDFYHSFRRLNLLVPGVWLTRAHPHGECCESFSNFTFFQHSSAYVAG